MRSTRYLAIFMLTASFLIAGMVANAVATDKVPDKTRNHPAKHNATIPAAGGSATPTQPDASTPLSPRQKKPKTSISEPIPEAPDQNLETQEDEVLPPQPHQTGPASFPGTNRPSELYAYARAQEAIMDEVKDGSADYSKIAYWYKLAAQEGLPESSLALAALYQSGKAAPPQPESAKKLIAFATGMLKSQIASGSGDAAVQLATVYRDGLGVEKSEKDFMFWLVKGMEMKSPKAALLLGQITMWGTYPGYTREQSLDLLQQAANGGLTAAWLEVGFACAGAYGGMVDSPRSFQAFRKAADGGNPDGFHQVGIAYLSGIGTEKNEAEGFKFIKQAAASGNPEAMYNLGMLYDKGIGIPRNIPETIEWMKKASDLGLTSAGYYLGMLYINGDGIGKDSAKGIGYLKQAAVKKNVMARNALHKMGVTW